MKKIRYVFSLLIVLVLILGLWVKNGRETGYEKTEYLFDTVCTVTVYGKEKKAAADGVFKRLAEIHTLTDLYDPKSDVSRINAAKANESVAVNEAITDIISRAYEISDCTNGEFDITIAAVSQLWNFKAENPSLPKKEDIEKALESVGYKNIAVDKNKSEVTKKITGAMIDLGGAAKGYAGDEAAKVLEEYDISGAIIDLGGNVVCKGENPKSKNGKWRIGLQKPFAANGEYSQTIEIASGAVVTSGTYQRSFRLDGMLYHHLLSPKTGFPENASYNSATVISESSLTADLLSTACFLIGEQEGAALAKKYNAEVYYQD